MHTKIPVRVLGVAAGLAAISATTQLTHIGFQSPQFGMWIDIVAVSWLMAFFMFGFRIAAVVSLMGGLVITLFAPETWLGASMKWTATLPLWATLSAWSLLHGRDHGGYQRFAQIVSPLLLGLALRSALMIPLNYYYAIPIWTGMSPSEAINVIPWYIIALFNTVQGCIDVILAWIVVYKFKVYRFGSSLQTQQ